MASEVYYNEHAPEEVERQRIAAVGQALALELGEGWQVKPWNADDDGRMHYATVTGPDGMAISIHGAGWAGCGRLSLSGEYPRRDGGNYYAPREDRAKATYAADRAPKVIARDAVRRMVPLYRTQYAEGLRQAQIHDAYESAAAANAERMRIALGTNDGTNHREPHAFYLNAQGRTYTSGRAGDDDVHFDRLTTTIAKGVRIAAILAEPEEVQI